MTSKLEQEVKFYLNNLDALEKRLITQGASLKQPRTLEVNLRFDTPDRRLSESFQVLRLRQDQRTRLTYKGASDPERDVSAREELEVEVDDLKTTRAILESLGFEVMVTYEKFRTAYTLGEVEISLDEMPFGTFCEIEGPDTQSIRSTAERLSLDWDARSKLSYLTLFNLVRENRNLVISDLDFQSFKDHKITSKDLEMIAAD